MIRLAGLFALIVALALWVFFAGSLLEGVGSGGSLLGTASPSRTSTAEPTTSPVVATASPAPPPTATAVPTFAATPVPTIEPLPTSYTVVAGDNLTTIARRFGVTLDALARANSIDSSSPVRIGQVLVIPPR